MLPCVRPHVIPSLSAYPAIVVVLLSLLQAPAAIAQLEIPSQNVKGNNQQSNNINASGDSSLNPPSAATSGLREFPLKIEGDGAFTRGNNTQFVLLQSPRGVFGRIDLVPDDRKQQPVRMLLHGQEKESFSVSPGHYTLRMAFWRPGQTKPSEYPHTSEFSLGRGQTATLEISRDDYSSIKSWLKQQEEEKEQKVQTRSRSGILNDKTR